MLTTRIIVESPDTGVVSMDVTVQWCTRDSFMRQLGRRFPYHTVRQLGPEWKGEGNLVGRRLPAFPRRAA